MSLTDILSQYAGTPRPQPDTPAHFEEAARSTSPADLSSALSSMFRSDATPSFGQLVGSLFEKSDPQQRAGLLNHLIGALGPGAAGTVGGILSRALGSTANTATAVASGVTAQQASQVSPSDVTALAAHAEQQNPSVVDRVGSFYAQHPTLVKTLGGAALAVTLGRLYRH
jgi:hypothetical protein